MKFIAERGNLHTLISNPAVYRIRIPGRLYPDCSVYLQGMTVTSVEIEGQATITALTGLLPDQSALMGVLQQLFSRVIPVLSVEWLGDDIPSGTARPV